MRESGTRSPEAELGLLDATMIGIGAMIGAGIFVLTGMAAKTAGPAAILVFFLNGIVTTFTGLSYAELASAIPRSGGGYAFVEDVFGGLISFLMGWMVWFAQMIAGALYALGFAPNLLELAHHYFGRTIPSPQQANPVVIPGLAAVAIISLVSINIISTAASGRVETIFTGVKIGILVLFVVFGLQSEAFSQAKLQPLFPKGHSPVNLLTGMGLTFVAFEGYDLITTVTGEVENPRKNIPKAIFISLAVTVFIYVAVVTVAVGTLGAHELGMAGETGIAEAAKSFMPTIPLIGGGEVIIIFGAVFSTITALNAVIISSSRVAFAMGRQGQSLPQIGHIHHRYGTPARALVLSSIVMVLSVLFLPIRLVGNLTSLVFLLSFTLVNASVIKLRRSRTDMRRPFEMPLYPLPPVLGIVFNIILGFFISWETWILGGCWVLVGLVFYLILTWYKEKSSPSKHG